MASRGRKANRDWINDPAGVVPVIASLLYIDQHFLWQLKEVPQGDKPRLCLISCTYCGDYIAKVLAIKYNSTGNLMTYLRTKHPKIAKEIEDKEAQKKTTG